MVSVIFHFQVPHNTLFFVQQYQLFFELIVHPILDDVISHSIHLHNLLLRNYFHVHEYNPYHLNYPIEFGKYIFLV